MTEKNLTKIPKRNAKDTVHNLVKAGLSAIPGIGGPVSVLFTQVIAPSIANRRDDFLESIVRKLEDLEDKIEDFKIENLQGNESFISTIMQASRVVIATHQKVKREADIFNNY